MHTIYILTHRGYRSKHIISSRLSVYSAKNGLLVDGSKVTSLNLIRTDSASPTSFREKFVLLPICDNVRVVAENRQSATDCTTLPKHCSKIAEHKCE